MQKALKHLILYKIQKKHPMFLLLHRIHTLSCLGISNQRPVSMDNFVLQIRNLHNKTAFLYSKTFKYKC